MAVLQFFPVIGAGNGGVNTLYAGTISASGTSGLVTTGQDMLIRIACTAPVNVRFGTTVNLSTATINDILIPIGATIFDMGHFNNAIYIFAAASATVTVNTVSRN